MTVDGVTTSVILDMGERMYFISYICRHKWDSPKMAGVKLHMVNGLIQSPAGMIIDHSLHESKSQKTNANFIDLNSCMRYL